MLTWIQGYTPSAAVVLATMNYTAQCAVESIVYVDGACVMLMPIDAAHEYQGDMQAVGRFMPDGAEPRRISDEQPSDLDRWVARVADLEDILRDRDDTIDRLVVARDAALAEVELLRQDMKELLDESPPDAESRG
jgi:hypothetical protein